jgi:hypothetical protein
MNSHSLKKDDGPHGGDAGDAGTAFKAELADTQLKFRVCPVCNSEFPGGLRGQRGLDLQPRPQMSAKNAKTAKCPPHHPSGLPRCPGCLLEGPRLSEASRLAQSNVQQKARDCGMPDPPADLPYHVAKSYTDTLALRQRMISIRKKQYVKRCVELRRAEGQQVRDGLKYAKCLKKLRAWTKKSKRDLCLERKMPREAAAETEELLKKS